MHCVAAFLLDPTICYTIFATLPLSLQDSIVVASIHYLIKNGYQLYIMTLEKTEKKFFRTTENKNCA